MGYRVDDFTLDLEKLAYIVGEGLLSEWEEMFVLSLSNQSVTTPLSAKQVLKLHDIIEKSVTNGWFEKGWSN